MFLKARFSLDAGIKRSLRAKQPSFGHDGLGELVYLRTYARRKENGRPEQWSDTVERVTQGTFNILKNHMENHHLPWSEDHWQKTAFNFGHAMYDMKFLPPGRGLWAMGTDFVAENGSMALNNCAFVDTIDLVTAASWTMDALMCGCGVGFNTNFTKPLKRPEGTCKYLVPDTREGWVDSLRQLLNAFVTGSPLPVFDYTKIRPPGTPIRGFGGTSTGYQPLEKLHQRVLGYCQRNLNGYTTSTRFTVDLFNAIGACVVAGNIRRSSEIALGRPQDTEFISLKDLTVNPDRSDIYWMSNNTVQFSSTEEFSKYIPIVANQIRSSGNGEPGIYNMLNVQQHGRVNKHHDPTTGLNTPSREQEPDRAIGVNPCLTADTLIFTSSGYVPLGKLVGKSFEVVIPFQGEQISVMSTKQGFWSTGVKPVFKITLENGYSVKATSNHQFLSVDHNEDIEKWTTVDNLNIYTHLKIMDGSNSRVISIESFGKEEVYDCTIPTYHYFVANGIISHNCGEIPLESYEMCNLAEVFPSRCTVGEVFDERTFHQTLKHATLYASIVSLLPTHSKETNAVVARNHRIGVSLSGTVLLSEEVGYSGMINLLKKGYSTVRTTNNYLMDSAGVPRSIRVTTIKPSGTVSKLAGVPEGIHFPIENRYIIRRIRISKTHDIATFLIKQGVPYEDDTYSDDTYVFEFPVDQGEVRSLKEVSMWEQLKMAELYQRWWSDNSVSVTINYDEQEAKNLEEAIASSIPNIKTLSFAPKSNLRYAQAPVEAIDEEEYKYRKNRLRDLNMSKYVSEQGEDVSLPKFCDNGSCEL